MFRVLEPASCGPLKLPNRIIRSATWDMMATEDGEVTDESVKLYNDLGAGGVGLIITGYAYISPAGKANWGQYGIYSDAMIPGMRRIAQAAHEGGTKIVGQIVHSGGMSGYLSAAGQVALAPTALVGRQPQRTMTEEEVEGILADFAAAAVRVREAGFDGVQIHGAHGYLVSQFFSPVANQRQDRWGGSAENRRRFAVEVVRRIRAAVGPDFPVLIKFGVMDDSEGGATIEEGIAAVRAMAEAGLDAVEVSAGIGSGKLGPVQMLSDAVKEVAYYRERAGQVKRGVNVPVSVVGGVRYLETAEDIVAAGDADFVSISRALIREPGLVRRWQEGDLRRATCITCGKCQTACRRGEPLACQQDKAAREGRSID